MDSLLERCGFIYQTARQMTHIFGLECDIFILKICIIKYDKALISKEYICLCIFNIYVVSDGSFGLMPRRGNIARSMCHFLYPLEIPSEFLQFCEKVRLQSVIEIEQRCKIEQNS